MDDNVLNGGSENGSLIVAALTPMRNPATGSANPSASFPALWGYIEPALDHIVRSPSINTEKAPAIDVSYHMGIHTAVYNYFTSSRFDIVGAASATVRSNGKSTPPGNPHGADLYDKLDRYYEEICQEILASAPIDDSDLVRYLVPCFNRYTAGAQSVNRLLNYVNRHYVKHAVDDDRGWFRMSDMLDVFAQTIQEEMAANGKSLAQKTAARKKIEKRMGEKKLAELRKWGYTEGGTAEQLVVAEAAAEASSPVDRIVPLLSLAHRRFREEVVRHLLAIPKAKKGKNKKYKKPPGSSTSSAEGDPPGPKSRLARAVKHLVENDDTDIQERQQLASGLNKCLAVVGIPNDHLLRKKLDRFCQSKG